MTRKQLFKACSENRFIAARDWRGVVYGCNSAVALLGLRKKFAIDDTETNFQSFYPISFAEYIRIKSAFV